MHPSALETGRQFFETYWREDCHNILDIGSRDVNGTLRAVKPEGAAYLGVDLTPGPGVELVLQDPHRLPFDDASFDVVVSTSCLEHDPLFWLTFAEMARVVKPGGLIYINAPSNGNYHGYPFDHWRFYPDAGLALARWSERVGTPVALIESFIGKRVGADPWADNVMVFARQPFAHPLPEPLLCDRLPGATNLRRGEAEALDRFQALPEDLRDLKQAQARSKALQEQLEASQAREAALSAELAALQAEQTASEADGGAASLAGDGG
ncbi:class I SAM-dependent methyltransferase [Thiorhodovibrio frisius]|uniref:Methylase involved in ubiquinone/menaquinone biosynthesis n=1 Tax=Thiorhodovibrio frisius TaxID=631362 RepID=H8YVU7_9GAMM|nr:class I SAM-dependent methyltransferase [Thiorhodovibrio frisius]EIC23738.1 methylase involved in ubiquinone/menaquinone biosynthesis [Thiorhodovibrio frisius]WPL20145.1 Phthiotriol/phenolphthiotriol dimycocerosates methyltransferase [Thiorhodovibrio frisius]